MCEAGRPLAAPLVHSRIDVEETPMHGILKLPMRAAWIKYVIIFAGVFLFRLLPFRAPNVEPVLASLMPLSKRFGALSSALFAVLSIVLYDAVTSGFGIWTAVTALAYGAIGIASYLYFRNREATRGNFVRFTIVSILFYDAVTGLTVGPIAFHQPLASALVGQIPFTILHLLGSIVFAALVSPALYRWLARSPVVVPHAIAEKIAL